MVTHSGWCIYMSPGLPALTSSSERKLCEAGDTFTVKNKGDLPLFENGFLSRAFSVSYTTTSTSFTHRLRCWWLLGQLA